MPNPTQTTDLYHVIGKLESHIEKLNENQQDLKVTLEKMQKRLSNIEKSHSFLRGGVAALLAVGAIFGAIVDHLVRWVMGR